MKDIATAPPPFCPAVPAPLRAGTNPARLVWAFSRNPIAVWADFQFDVWRHDFRYFGVRATLLNHPEDIHLAFGRHGRDLGLEPIRQKVVRPVFGDGVISAEGPRWRDSRRLMAQAIGQLPNDALANSTVAGVQSALAALPAEIDGTDLADRLTIQAQNTALFGGALTPHIPRYLAARDAFLRSVGPNLTWRVLGLPGWMPRPGGRAERHNKARFDAITRQLAADARRMPDTVLGQLAASHRAAGLPDAMLRDNILTLISSSQETLGRSIAWALFLLAKSPDDLAQVQDEIATLPSNAAPERWPELLPHTTACLRETMRLYPSLPILSRIARKPIRLPSGDIPAGQVVFLNVWILHRHRQLWDAPDAFMPTRFHNIGTSLPPGYLPFGTGARACIGGRMALLQGVILLAETLRRFTPHYRGQSDPQPQMRITLAPGNGIPLHMAPR